MKIAEALMNKSSLQTKIAQLRSRISVATLVQEGSQPLEDTNALLDEYIKTQKELTKLVTQIQAANSKNMLLDENDKSSSLSLQDALVKRDGLLSLAEGLRSIAGEAVPNMRYTQNEIKIISTLNPKDIQKQADKFAKEARELDILIQKSNWSIDI